MIRCIDCHGGNTLLARLRTDWLAARDLAVYLVGAGREPDTLSQPMADANCTGCHRGTIGGAFHRIRAHQGGMPVGCADCHRVHADSTGPVHTDPAHTRARCAQCHPGLAPRVLRLAGLTPPSP